MCPHVYTNIIHPFRSSVELSSERNIWILCYTKQGSYTNNSSFGCAGSIRADPAPLDCCQMDTAIPLLSRASAMRIATAVTRPTMVASSG